MDNPVRITVEAKTDERCSTYLFDETLLALFSDDERPLRAEAVLMIVEEMIRRVKNEPSP